MPVATTDITLLGLLVAVAVVAVLATSIGYTRGKKSGEQEANSLPRSWCTEYVLFSDEGRVCRYSAPDGGYEYILSKETLRRFLGEESHANCPERVRICFFQHGDNLQVISVEALQP